MRTPYIPVDVARRDARVAAHEAIQSFDANIKTGSYYDLMTLLGHKYPKDNYPTFASVMTEQDLEYCKALAGPNGYTIYKMLLARKEA